MEYRLDLTTLLLMLGKGTGNLRADISSLPKIKGRGQAMLRLEKGTITTCTIQSERNGEIISGEMAIKLLQNLILEWHYTEDQVSANTLAPRTQPLAAFPPLAAIPRRTHPISQRDFLTWPRFYRTVYSLIDGRASVNQIISLLGREQEIPEILEVLNRLHHHGLISLDA